MLLKTIQPSHYNLISWRLVNAIVITWPLLDTTWVWNVDFGLVLEWWRCEKNPNMDRFRINSFEQKNAALVLSVQYAQWAIHTNNTIKKKQTTDKKESLWKMWWPWKGPFVATGLPEVDIIGGICGYSIAKTKPKSFFNASRTASVTGELQSQVPVTWFSLHFWWKMTFNPSLKIRRFTINIYAWNQLKYTEDVYG